MLLLFKYTLKYALEDTSIREVIKALMRNTMTMHHYHDDYHDDYHYNYHDDYRNGYVDDYQDDYNLMIIMMTVVMIFMMILYVSRLFIPFLIFNTSFNRVLLRT